MSRGVCRLCQSLNFCLNISTSVQVLAVHDSFSGWSAFSAGSPNLNFRTGDMWGLHIITSIKIIS